MSDDHVTILGVLHMHTKFLLVGNVFLSSCQRPKWVVTWATYSFFESQNLCFNAERHPYTGNLSLETSGDSKNRFLHCGDVIGLQSPVD